MSNFSDDDFYLSSYADITKLVKFDASPLTTGTLATLKLPALAGGSSNTLACLGIQQIWTDQQNFDDSGTATPPINVTIASPAANNNAMQVTDVTSGYTQMLAIPLAGLTNNRQIYMPDRTGALITHDSDHDVNLTGQTTNKGTTSITPTPPAGIYVVYIYLQTTTAGSGTNTVTIGWTDNVGATTDATTTLSLGSTGRTYVAIPIYIASSSPTYAVNMGGGSGTWSIRIRLVSLE